MYLVFVFLCLRASESMMACVYLCIWCVIFVFACEWEYYGMRIFVYLVFSVCVFACEWEYDGMRIFVYLVSLTIICHSHRSHLLPNSITSGSRQGKIIIQ